MASLNRRAAASGLLLLLFLAAYAIHRGDGQQPTTRGRKTTHIHPDTHPLTTLGTQIHQADRYRGYASGSLQELGLAGRPAAVVCSVLPT
eukprot:scaffold53319_cov34-Prasinocladus_malaysianus.AAC.2